ncbi:hypothetical protein [Clostridium sp. LIBA-8841]|uniref:hypothetical protein n=1 Tax=Clostridium sp. LIBA-8841 TaxID=2987530 RepID=UPI002AC63734|nr:hypothetical protein [Clostridium sp. LIBA-8841]MDZ5252417.1 hypothetical protein [Clostridium sp. LIBA-8841]
MKFLRRIVIAFLAILLITIGSYFLMPIKIGTASNMFKERPKYIIITEMKVDINGIPKVEAYEIGNKNTIENLYNGLKDIKILKTFKDSSSLNSYGVYMGEEYMLISLTDEFVRIGNETFKVINQDEAYSDLLSEIKEGFIKSQKNM